MTNDTVGATATQADVLAVVAELIGEVVGDEFFLDEPITMTTSFNDDLELESIEFVALAELLAERYGQEVDFVAWLGSMELGELISLSVGQLVDLITATATSGLDGDPAAGTTAPAGAASPATTGS